MRTVVILLTDAGSKKRASSSVFLALVFTVVIMLFTAVCALLCYQAEKTNIKRDLDIAVESEFGKFYRPLFDDYRLLYYMDSDNDMFEADVLSYFMMNQEERPGILRLKPAGFDASEKYYAVDDDCSNVFKQMTDGIVYTMGEDAVNRMAEKIKNRFGLFEETDEVLDTVSEDADTAKDDAHTQEQILELLRMVEGIYIKSGNIKCEDLYVKQAVSDEDISESTSGIDSPAVWEAVKISKWSIMEELKKLDKDDVEITGNKFKRFINKIKKLKEITEKAYKLAADIDGSISDTARGECICDIRSMKRKLYENIGILSSIAEGGHTAKECMEAFEAYHVKDMYFDYSTLSLKKEDNPVEKLNMNNSDIVSFLTDDTDISSSYIEETKIYEHLSGDDNDRDDENSGGAPGDEEDDISDFKDTEQLPDYISSCKAGSLLSDIEELACFNMYVNKYLSDYADKEDEDDKKRALSYEKEYIICGRQGDRENLHSVVNRLLLIRTGVSFVYLLSDREKSSLAYAAAAAVVGFTGMEALVRCTQYIILAGWAYEDACVDVSALLRGKKIPYVKKKSNLNIQFNELVSFNKELIKQKAKAIDNSSGVKYSDFLVLFLNMCKKKTSLQRCMDVIHYNMKLRHSKLFSFQNAMYKAEVGIECARPYFMEAKTSFCYR